MEAYLKRREQTIHRLEDKLTRLKRVKDSCSEEVDKVLKQYPECKFEGLALKSDLFRACDKIEVDSKDPEKIKNLHSEDIDLELVDQYQDLLRGYVLCPNLLKAETFANSLSSSSLIIRPRHHKDTGLRKLYMGQNTTWQYSNNATLIFELQFHDQDSYRKWSNKGNHKVYEEKRNLVWWNTLESRIQKSLKRICCDQSDEAEQYQLICALGDPKIQWIRQHHGKNTLDDDDDDNPWLNLKKEEKTMSPLFGDGKTLYYRLQNVWTSGYLHMENKVLESGKAWPCWWSAMWTLHEVSPGVYQIQNRYLGKYLHIQKGDSLVASGINESGIKKSLESSKWVLEAKSSNYRIKNYGQKHLAINVEKGPVRVSKIYDVWASALWRLEPVP